MPIAYFAASSRVANTFVNCKLVIRFVRQPAVKSLLEDLHNAMVRVPRNESLPWPRLANSDEAQAHALPRHSPKFCVRPPRYRTEPIDASRLEFRAVCEYRGLLLQDHMPDRRSARTPPDIKHRIADVGLRLNSLIKCFPAEQRRDGG